MLKRKYFTITGDPPIDVKELKEELSVFFDRNVKECEIVKAIFQVAKDHKEEIKIYL